MQCNTTFAGMKEPIQNIIQGITNGDACSIEMFFSKPGGKKYLENLSLILIHTLPYNYAEKEKLYLDFVKVLNGIEQHIRQKNGQKILDGIFLQD